MTLPTCNQYSLFFALQLHTETEIISFVHIYQSRTAVHVIGGRHQ